MTTTTLTLADFLLARVAEDEAVARAAMNVPVGTERTTSSPPPFGGAESPISDVPSADDLHPIGHWGWCPINGRIMVSDSGLWDESEPIGASFYRATVDARSGDGTARHIARHDPARVLAQCEAKRRIVERARHIEAMQDTSGSFTIADLEYDEHILPALASIWADHPDFDPAWRLP